MTRNILLICSLIVLLTGVQAEPAWAQKGGGPGGPSNGLNLLPNDTIDFGDVATDGVSSITVNPRLQNSGLTPINVEIPADLGAFTVGAGSGSYSLAPGAFVDLSITYQPDLRGLDFVQIRFNAADPLVMTLKGRGIQDLDCGSDKNKIDFGNVEIGSPQTFNVFLGNSTSSTQMLRLSGMCNAFTVTPPAINVDPGQVGQFAVEFDPQYAGEYVGEYWASCGSSVWLSGTGTTPSPKAGPALADGSRSTVLSLAAAPNPMRSAGSIRYANLGATPISATLRVVDLRGRVVRSQPLEISQGSHVWYWDGHDQDGQSVASGVYLIELVAPGATAREKVTILR